PSERISVHRESRVRVERMEEGKQSLLKGLQNVQEAFALRWKERRRDREVLEVPKTPVREVRSEIEPLDRVVEVDRVDPDVVSASVRLDELRDRMVLRFECVPGHRVSNLDPKVERKVLRGGEEADGKQGEHCRCFPKPVGEVAADAP